MSIRKFIAVGALINAMVALYLHMWKIGLTGSLACSSGGGCEYVQGSRYGWFLGYDVALIGTVGYSLLFVTALIGSLPAFEDRKWPAVLMQFMVFPALLFTLRLKYGEFIVLKSFCVWCAVSAVSITVFTVLMFVERKRLQRLGA